MTRVSVDVRATARRRRGRAGQPIRALADALVAVTASRARRARGRETVGTHRHRWRIGGDPPPPSAARRSAAHAWTGADRHAPDAAAPAWSPRSARRDGRRSSATSVEARLAAPSGTTGTPGVDRPRARRPDRAHGRDGLAVRCGVGPRPAPGCRPAAYTVDAGLVSGAISSSETDIPVARRPGCPHRPQPESYPSEVHTHAPAPDPPPRALHRTRPPTSSTERIAAAKAALGDRLFILGHHYQRDEVMRWADARGDSLPALGARPGAARGRLHRVLRRALHGRVGRRAHRRPPEVILPDLNAGCSMADMADIDEVEEAWEALAAVIDIERLVPITYMNSLGRAEGVRGRARRRRVHVDQRPAVLDWASAAAVGERSGPPGGDKVALLPRPAPGPQHRPRHGLRPRRHAGVEPPLRARRAHRGATARRPRSCCGRATARCTSGSAPSTSRRSGPSTPTAS